MSVTIKMEPVQMDDSTASQPNGKTKNRQRSSADGSELLRCKRRIHFGAGGAAAAGFGLSAQSQPPAAVARRNERERNRVRMVNMGFNTLRQHVPNGAKNKKMSKVETLKSAVEYIKQLQELLHESAGSESQLRMHGSENVFPRTSSSFPSTSSVQSPAYSEASSPTPSWNSDASSPYQSYSPQDEEEIMDFAAWFS